MAVAILLLVSAPPAISQPSRTDELVAGDVLSVPWTALGLPAEIDISTAAGNQDFTLPLPLGANPKHLRQSICRPSPPVTSRSRWTPTYRRRR
jgi:hypothetical protein